ncbi:MAG: CDP-alcohol phosphatidyltransferase family protein [Candidatus Hodarchaeota archaeon]
MTSQSFKEFKEITQGKKLEDRKRRNDWWHYPFTFISKYITWILVKTPITANFVTIFGCMIGLLGLLFIGFGNSLFIIVGFILLYLYFLSDEIDGEVARYKKQVSIKGMYYDQVCHFIFLGCFFSSFGFNIYRINSEFLYIIFGFLTTIFILGIRTVRKIAIIASTKKEVKEIINQKEEVNQEKSSKSFFKLIKKIIFNLINAFSHTHLITTVFFVGNIIFIYSGHFQILEIIMICYFVFMSLVFSSFIIIKSRSITKDIIAIQQSK